MSDDDSVWSAVRAAAAVTGLFKRSAAIGALALAACGGPTAGTSAAAPENRTSVAAPVDAGVDGPACEHDRGWGSPCCEAIDNQAPACMAWGPPVPPAFAEVAA